MSTVDQAWLTGVSQVATKSKTTAIPVQQRSEKPSFEPKPRRTVRPKGGGHPNNVRNSKQRASAQEQHGPWFAINSRRTCMSTWSIRPSDDAALTYAIFEAALIGNWPDSKRVIACSGYFSASGTKKFACWRGGGGGKVTTARPARRKFN